MTKAELMFLLSKIEGNPEVILGTSTRCEFDTNLQAEDICYEDNIYILLPQTTLDKLSEYFKSGKDQEGG
jgi:hypothetical protein